MKALVEYVAKSLVEHPEAVRVREMRQKDRILLELSVAKEDMGRVIGRSGRVANALRTLLRVVAEREGCPVTLDVVEP
ncbi:MAG: KH domain-containing protein [Anaerolineales bacterium]|nr:KH domain-containing protein [Anaerolineales bacterium]MCX7608130.1 KH domain-containing protein [Anaerolineales bacterium]MDW8226279.1 KH domain-containing protein [Anaerolineales bacterium]